jgi:hypothetical protein
VLLGHPVEVGRGDPGPNLRQHAVDRGGHDPAGSAHPVDLG